MTEEQKKKCDKIINSYEERYNYYIFITSLKLTFYINMIELFT